MFHLGHSLPLSKSIFSLKRKLECFSDVIKTNFTSIIFEALYEQFLIERQESKSGLVFITLDALTLHVITVILEIRAHS